MTITKALKGAGEYSVASIVYGVVFFYPHTSLLEMQLSIILMMAVLIFVSHFITWLRKWLNFAEIVSLLAFAPLGLYILLNGLDNSTRIILAVFILAVLGKIAAYTLGRLRIFHTNEDLLPLTAAKLALWLLAWAGTTSLLVTLGYSSYQSILLKLTDG
jgi:hypothetical protein